MTNPLFERPEIAQLSDIGLEFPEPWQVIDHFERVIADFFGAPYAITTDCCTHALELVLRHLNHRDAVILPRHTYMSVPMMLDKLAIPYSFRRQEWQERYDVITDLVEDAATLWRRGSYRPGRFMCVSFQNKKHLKIGRGGAIITDDAEAYQRLLRWRFDDRSPELLQRDVDVRECGYHYYMTPDDAARGLLLFHALADAPYRPWGWQDYRDLQEFTYFREHDFAE